MKLPAAVVALLLAACRNESAPSGDVRVEAPYISHYFADGYIPTTRWQYEFGSARDTVDVTIRLVLPPRSYAQLGSPVPAETAEDPRVLPSVRVERLEAELFEAGAAQTKAEDRVAHIRNELEAAKRIAASRKGG